MIHNILSNAKWIWGELSPEHNLYVDFITDFTVPTPFQQASLTISADSHYNIWVNGTFLPITQYADYTHYKVYDEVDITQWIQQGINRLCVIGYCQNEDSSTYRQGQAGVAYAVAIDDAVVAVSDDGTLCRLSREYQSGDIEKFTGQLSFSFRYNANGYDGWREEGFIPTIGWQAATITTAAPQVYPRPIANLTICPCKTAVVLSQGVFFENQGKAVPAGDRMQQAALSFREFRNMTGEQPPMVLPHAAGIRFQSTDGDGMYIVVDLQQEEAGFLDIELSLPHKAEILIGFGEHLDDLRVRSSVGGRQFAAVYQGRAGRQTFTHYFKRLGCRYIQLHVYAPEVTVYYAGLRPAMYPVKVKSAFHCADALHNRIFEVSRRTLELCMHEHYEDCPWREQALYAMDSRNQMLCGYYVFDDYTFSQASLRLLALSQRQDGLLELCAPARVGVTIPSFSLSFVTAVYENVLFSHDVKFAAEMMPYIERILSVFLEKIGENGLVSCFTETYCWNFYEWREGLDGGSIFREQEIPVTYDAPLNGFLSLALEGAARICEWLGRDVQQQQYETIRTSLNRAMSAFWNESSGAFCSYLDKGEQRHYCELSQALLVCAGVADERQQAIVLQKLAYPTGEWIPTTLSCSIYKYEALMQMPNTYGRLVIDQIGQVWGKMLFAGATSFWETEKGAWDFDNAGSLCHGWSAIPIYIYYRYVLGISACQPEQHPQFCGLYEAEYIPN